MADRTERVILTLQDDFSDRMARVAASTEAASRALHDLDGSQGGLGSSTRRTTDEILRQNGVIRDQNGRLHDSNGRFISAEQAMRRYGASAGDSNSQIDRLSASIDRLSSRLGDQRSGIDRTSQALRRGGSDIDSYSGRLGLMTKAVVSLGPALLPIAAAAVPAMTSVAAGLGAAAGAAGTLMLAFHGMGDAFTALNKAQLDPTTENLQALQQAMAKIGPAGEQFVRYIDSLSSQFGDLQNIARQGLFPGVEDGINDLLTRMPLVKDVVNRLSTELGKLATDAGKSLGGDQWTAFFNYIRTDAAPTLDAFARATGNFANGLGNMLVAFAPLTRSFTSGLLSMSESFRNWTSNTNNFQGFIDYVRSVGPEVRDFFTSLAQATGAVVKALAPWGSVVLPALTGVAKAFTAIESSSIGPALTSGAAAMIGFGVAARTLGTGLTRAQGSLRSFRSDLALLSRSTAQNNFGAANANAAAAAWQRMGDRLSAALRGGAGVAGMLALSDAANRAGGSLKGFETVAGTALLGATAGPVGAAIGAIAGAMSLLGSSTEETKADIGDLSSTFNTLTGAATTATQQMVTNNLAQQGFGQYAQELGVSLGTVTQAVMGNGTAMDQIDAKIKQLSAGTGVAGDAFDNLGTKIHNQASQYKLQATAAKDAAATNGQMAGSIDDAASASQRAATALQNYINKEHELHDTTLSNLDAQFAYGQAVADAKKQADSAEQGLNRYTKAGRDNEAAMSKMTAQYNAQGQGIKNNVKGYENAKQRIAEFGRQMGLTSAQIRGFQAELDKPKKLDVNDVEAQQKIKAVTRLMSTYGLTKAQATALLNDAASGKIHSVQQLVDKYGLSKKTATALLHDLASGKLGQILALINSLHDKTVTVRLNHITENTVTTHYRTTSSGSSTAPPNRTPKAGGGYVRGPGTTTSDSIPALLSDQEYVVKAAAVQKYGVGLMDRINSMAFANGGLVQRYASGGYVSGSFAYGPDFVALFKHLDSTLGTLATRVGKPAHGGFPGGNGSTRAASFGYGPGFGPGGGGGSLANPRSRYSPLYGIGDKRISAAELGARVANNLTDRQIRDLGKSLDDLNKKSLTKFGKALDDAATTVKARADAAKTTLQNEQSKQSDLASTVRQSLTVDAFATSDTGSTWNSATSAAAGPTRASVRAALTTQASNARALSGYLATIRKRLGSGPQADAFISWILSQSDPVADAKIFATESASALSSDQRLYRSSTAAVTAAGTAGGAIYNNEVAADRANWHAQTAELKAIRALHKQELAELKAMQKQAHARAAAAAKQREKNHKEAQASRDKNSPAKANAKAARDAKR